MIGLNLSEEPRAIREAKEEEAIDLITHQLTVKFRQELPESVRSQIATLSLPQLKVLSEALLGFTRVADLENWLTEQTQ